MPMKMLLRCDFLAGQNNRREVAIMKILMRFYYNLGASTALLLFLLRFLSFWPKFRVVAESPSFNMDLFCL